VIEGYGLSWDDRAFFPRRTVDQCLQMFLVNVGKSIPSWPTYALIVYYLDDSSQFSIVFTTLDDHDAANFNKFPPCRFDVDSSHSDEIAAREMSALGVPKQNGDSCAHSVQVAVNEFVVAKVRDREVLCCSLKVTRN
jgi:hypothetical protein